MVLENGSTSLAKAANEKRPMRVNAQISGTLGFLRGSSVRGQLLLVGHLCEQSWRQ